MAHTVKAFRKADVGVFPAENQKEIEHQYKAFLHYEIVIKQYREPVKQDEVVKQHEDVNYNEDRGLSDYTGQDEEYHNKVN